MSNPLRLRLVRSLQCRRGAAAVEFAFVITPFVFALFAIIESGLIFVTQINLSNATMVLARQIRTGSVMAAGTSGPTTGATLSLIDFKTRICSRVQIIPMATCMSQLQVDIRTQAAFGAGQSLVVPIVNFNFNVSSLCFNSGQSGSVVEFRAFYLWPVSTPLILSALVDAQSITIGGTTTSGKYHVITSTEAFRIEQNSAGSNAGSVC